MKTYLRSQFLRRVVIATLSLFSLFSTSYAFQTVDLGWKSTPVGTKTTSLNENAVPPNLDLQSRLFGIDDPSNIRRAGFSIAVSGDTVVIGAPREWNTNGNQAGAVYVYVRTGVGASTVWSQQARLLASDGAEGDQLGYSVAVDGDTIVAGAQTDDGMGGADEGSAYVFVRSGSIWTEQGKLTASDAGAGDLFGTSVSVSGDTAVAGAPYWDLSDNSNQGAVYVYKRVAGVWMEDQKITSPEGTLSTWFGIAVSVSGSDVAIGSPLDYIAGRANQGSVYVFHETVSAWNQQARLIADDGAEADRFGSSVSIDGNTVAAGAPLANIGMADDAGAAYVFVRSGVFWNQQGKLKSDDPLTRDTFGASVALSGEGLFIGVPGDATTLNWEQGSAFLFERDNLQWQQKAHVYADDGTSGERLGTSVGLDGELAAAGAPFGESGYYYGAAYAFYPSCAFALNPDSQLFGTEGGAGSFDISAAAGCGWAASSNATWVQLTGDTSGDGAGTVSYSVGPNTGIARTATISVGGSQFTVTQDTFCSFSVDPASLDAGSAGGPGSFAVNVDNQACTWTGESNDDWITVTSGSSGTGNGTVEFDLAANPGPVRQGSITAGGQEFVVTQATACSYSLSASSITAPAAGGNAGFSVLTTSLCPWNAQSNAAWITITGGASGTGDGAVSFSVAPNPGASRIGTITAGGNTFTVSQLSTNGILGTPYDFDGDGRTDVSIFRPNPSSVLGNAAPEGSSSQWWIFNSGSQSPLGITFGQADDVLVPADYTGDGKADVAFFRPSNSTWYVLRSEDFTFFAFPFGGTGDIPAPGDFDGDGKADPAVYRPSSGTWFILRSSDGGVSAVPFGVSEDKPVVADYDGDGMDDVAVYRPSVNQWWLLRSTAGVLGVQFGAAGDRSAIGDWTGDGKADIAFYRPTTSEYYVIRSEDSSFFAFPWGATGDISAVGDYDGDGVTDAAVYRPSIGTWFINGSTSGFLSVPFGLSGDTPVPSVSSQL